MATAYEPAATTLADWTTATEHVTAGRKPSLAHLLLRDARAARYTDNLRGTVIDAASACEVALAESIRAGLAAIGKPMIRQNDVMVLCKAHARQREINAVSENALRTQLARVA